MNDSTKIHNELIKYCQQLYTEDKTLYKVKTLKKKNLEGENFPVLSRDQKVECDQEITLNELTTALNQLNFSSAPDNDGLAPSFYKQFWNKLQSSLIKCFFAISEKRKPPIP